MSLTTDEKRALAFLALLVFLSAALRLLAAPEPVALPDGAGLDLAGHIEATRAAVAAEERRSTPLADGERLDPNTATAAELQRLPGVGPALAGRIVAEREGSGPFRTLDELTRVSGVGERSLARLAPHLALSPTAAARPRPLAGSASVVDLNGADAAALAGLPGVGPVLAERVVAYRDSVGGFGAVDELVRVKGIGPATLERIRERVRVYR